jgi:hypothetical protein
MSENQNELDLGKFRLSLEEAEDINRDYFEARAKAAGRRARSTKRVRAPEKDTYAQIRTEDAVAGFHSLRCPQALVWHRLQFLAWKAGSATVTLANKALSEMGVSRSMKSRALQRLEQDSLIKVKRRGRHSPTVTIINWRPIRSRSDK